MTDILYVDWWCQHCGYKCVIEHTPDDYECPACHWHFDRTGRPLAIPERKDA